MTLFRFNYYGLTTNKFSTDIVRTLSKRNRFSIELCDKFVAHVRCPTIISHPAFHLIALQVLFFPKESIGDIRSVSGDLAGMQNKYALIRLNTCCAFFEF